MSQSTLGDEDLFGEAAAEMREDVEEHLEKARAELPTAAEVWETEADNVLGVLNGLGQALDAGEAEEHLRQAKKWYAVGERADAFDDAADLAAEIEDLGEVIAAIADAGEAVNDLTTVIPDLRGTLQEVEGGADDGD